MNAFRKPLGNLLERKIKTCQYMTDLPGARDGEYVVIQIDSISYQKFSCYKKILNGSVIFCKICGSSKTLKYDV